MNSKIVSNLHILDLGGNKITDEGVKTIIAASGNFNNLQAVNLAENYITYEGLLAIAMAKPKFSKCTNLKVINLA